MLGSEKKYGIGRKYIVAGLSNFQVYLGRLIPIVLVVSVVVSVVSSGKIVLSSAKAHKGRAERSITTASKMLIIFFMVLPP